MEIIGRLTADASVRTTKDGREVVHFAVAVNDRYKPKDGSDLKKTTSFFDCSYWISTRITAFLLKGTLVELSGRVGLNVYKDLKGEPKGSLTFHVNRLKIHSGKKAGEEVQPVPVPASEPVESLPF